MKPSRLTAPVVHIIGVSVALVLALVLYLAMIHPRNNDTDTELAAAKAAEGAGGTHEDNVKTQKQLVDAVATAERNRADWKVFANEYMPALNWDKNMLQAYYLSNKINDIPREWGQWITNWYNAQIKSGVIRDPGVDFPIPPLASTPNEIANLTSITVPSAKSPWKVSLTCLTFDDAMAHLRRFNTMKKHGMPVLDHVTLSGHSPALTLAYDLSIYVIPTDNPPPPDSRIGGETGGGNGGGGARFGGGPGGPGGPMTGGPMSAGAMGGGPAGKGGTAKGAM